MACKYVLFISAAFDKPERLDKYKDVIVSYLKSVARKAPIKIGNIKTSHIRSELEKEGIIFDLHKQHPNSIKASNKKLINECEEIIFIAYKSDTKKSPIINELLETAREKNKKCYVLRIGEYE